MIVKYPVKVWAKYGGISASVIASSLLGSHICMMVGKAWWLVSPPESTGTLSHDSLGLKHIECIFAAWCTDYAAFASTIALSTASCATFSRSFTSDESPLLISRVQ